MIKYEVVNIKDKLVSLGINLEDLNLGDADYIIEHTGKKMRDRESDGWKKHGAFFRPNPERCIFIGEIIKKYKLESFFEVGFGRGAGSVSACKAFDELGGNGECMVVEPNVDENHMQFLSKVFPESWLNRIQMARGTSAQVLPQLTDEYDFVYVDGDHRKDAVKFDYEHLKDKCKYFMLFDDFRINDPQKDIEVFEAFQELSIDDKWKVELIKMDRRIFVDDRRLSDDELTYGQLLLTNTKAVEELTRSKEVKFEW